MSQRFGNTPKELSFPCYPAQQLPCQWHCEQYWRHRSLGAGTFGVWAGSEMPSFGFIGRRSGVPAIVALGEEGEELAFVDAERRGSGALNGWVDEGAWQLPG